MQVLYRVVEPESGSVIIDGVDVSTIGLKELRSRLSIIPQDSQCFEGKGQPSLPELADGMCRDAPGEHRPDGSCVGHGSVARSRAVSAEGARSLHGLCYPLLWS